jgi:hypothetical protein
MAGKDQQDDLFDWKPARNSDPNTSHIAADEIMPVLPYLEALVLNSIKSSGMIGRSLDGVCDDTGLDKVTASPRFRPLARKGLIVCIGTEIGRAGRPQQIWVATKP